MEISYIRPKNQRLIAVSIDGEQASPSLAQAKKLRELDKDGKLNGDVIDGILSEKKKEDRGVIISTAELEKYFWQGGHSRQNEGADHDFAGRVERETAARTGEGSEKDGAGQVTTSRHFVPRALPSASWLWWYISPVAACFFVQPGAGCQGCIAPPFYGGLPLTVCPGCAISPASGGGISSRAAPFPKTGKGRGDWA